MSKARALRGLPEDVHEKIVQKIATEGMTLEKVKQVVAEYQRTGTLNLD